MINTQTLPQYVIKRDGRRLPFEREKILSAMKKAFIETASEYTPETLEILLENVENHLQYEEAVEVERIQDLVELSLMEQDHFVVAKAYILYRELRRQRRLRRQDLLSYFPEFENFTELLLQIEADFDQDIYSLALLARKYHSIHRDGIDPETRFNALIKAAVELTEAEAPDWEFVAGRLYCYLYENQLQQAWAELGYSSKSHGEVGLSFAEKVSVLTDLGLYGTDIKAGYTETELNEAASWLDPERDYLLTYSAIDLLVNRYVVRSHEGVPLESIQDMFLGIALFLALPESKNRLKWARRFYDMLSRLEITMATPTLANARKSTHQLSSCFIDTVPDSLTGIYRSITSFARVSKFGGGMGLYFGKVRAQGSAIRGFEGAAGGVIRWIRLANDTAVAVDQLGVRQGAVAVYLDAWHKDIPEFLDLKTNNGDDRMKAHDVFPAICYPDYFWQQVRENFDGDWILFCPYEIKKIMGFSLEDYYGEEWTRRYLECIAEPRLPRRIIPLKEMIRLIIKSLAETGTPFTFNRDAVNRANPNKHRGMIYCSNLCTEIAQNMEAAEEIAEEILEVEGETVIQSRVKPGSFVVCNLASITLGKSPIPDEEAFAQLIESAVRALDNVISLNQYPLPDAKVNNEQYRPIGLGVSGYHHLLAKKGIPWESKEHLLFADQLFEKINYYAIRASVQIAREKGSYNYFEGSDWQTGAYFEKRNYHSDKWKKLAHEVARDGLRNGYLLAVAPTASTSIISGTTPGIDPIMERFFYDEKKNGLIPRVAPDLGPATYWLYKNAHSIDQSFVIQAGAVRQRHIDQASSMNLYITPDYSFRDILRLYLEAAEQGIKTIYYIRSQSLEIENCESCAS